MKGDTRVLDDGTCEVSSTAETLCAVGSRDEGFLAVRPFYRKSSRGPGILRQGPSPSTQDGTPCRLMFTGQAFDAILVWRRAG